MTESELRTIARLLRIAMGYESREHRIGLIRQSKFVDVALLGQRLTAAGFLHDTTVNDTMTLVDYSPPRGRRHDVH